MSSRSRQGRSAQETLRASLVWRGAAIRGAVLLVGKLAVLGTTIIATRLLTKTNAGTLFVGLAVGALLGSLLAIGLPEAISRGLGGLGERRSIETAHITVGAIGLWCIGAVLILVGSATLTTGLSLSFQTTLPFVTCVLGALAALESILATFMRVRGHALLAEFCVSLGSIVFVGALLALSLSHPVSGVGALWIRCAIETLIATPVAYATIRPYWRLRHSWSVRSSMRRMVRPALPLWMTSFSWFVLQNIGIAFLALVSGPIAVAYYQPLLKTADTAGGVASMFGPYLLPVAARLRAAGDMSQINSLYVQASRVAFALSVPILTLLAFDSQTITERLFGFSGHGTEMVAILLAVAYLLNATVGFNGIVLESLASLRTLASRSVIVVSITTIGNAMLISNFGATGAALGTLMSYVAINALNSTLLYRATSITPFQRRLLSPVLVTLLGVLAAVAVSLTVHVQLRVIAPILSSILPMALVLAPIVHHAIDRTKRMGTVPTVHNVVHDPVTIHQP
jgi:O-antigen/teichoic acid export membrane protein